MQASGAGSGVVGRNRNLLAQLGQRIGVLDRLCLSGELQFIALSYVQRSCSLRTAFAALPWAPAISFVASADTTCLPVVTAFKVWLSVLALADFAVALT